ncbi:MAG: discoidin domain-containing protein [Nocardioides sp.]|nr:discoidin domain-containing protein [Nocardioides sp.]
MKSRRGALALLMLTALIGALFIPVGSGAAAPTPWYEPVDRPSPDSEINVTGEPFTGTDADGDVRGFVDTHDHLMTNEAFGGKLVCGKPFSELGISDALRDCPEHYPNGAGALLENLTVDTDWRHDPVGWPTFQDWPSYTTMSHQQNYYAWVERSWRAGQRVMVTDLTSNGVICSIYVRDRGCDEMDSIRLQAEKTYDMQDYIDKMYGGPGKGWFRIVKSPAQAREVIKKGKLAVVLGVETSEPFGCKQVLDMAQCSKADIDQGLDELRSLGVQSMFLCHKFDNALCGVRFDEGTTGTIINIGQFLSTGTWWRTEECRGPQSDNPIGDAAVPEFEKKLPPGAAVPKYADGARCNVRGLTRLGEYALRGMMDRGMMVEVDHMSVKAAGRTLDILESKDYPGVVSSHSWMDRDWTERVYALGGFIGSYDMDSEAFVREAATTADLREEYDVALGYGSDFNGLGSHPTPRGADAPDKVTYPYRSYPDGPLVDRQVTGERTWDVNVDGGAHYGLIPDWIEDVRHLGGQGIVDELLGGAQSYLDTWVSTRDWSEPLNLARGARPSASSVQWTLLKRFVAGKANDGDVGTRWASRWSDQQWLALDLRSQQSISRVVLDWEDASAKSYQIEVSDDGSTWRTVWRTTDGAGGIETARFDPVTARHVRVHMSERATRYGYSLHEIAIHSG